MGYKKDSKRRIGGFTMAELLIVVAIITVLGGVGFIAVQNHQRSLEFTERNAIAKEIFIAAQNHLTMAESQGYLSVDKDVEKTRIITSVHGSGFSDATAGDAPAVPTTEGETPSGVTSNMLDLMLPMGSIDETVRVGGSYIIRYQVSPAQVLDVYFWKENEEQSYNDLVSLDVDARKRHNPIIGYYGGVDEQSPAKFNINAPTIEVENAERLIVRVKDTNYGASIEGLTLKLIITGESSNAQAAITLDGTEHKRVTSDSGEHTVVLDDITSAPAEDVIKDSLHFSDLNLYADTTDDIVQFKRNAGDNATKFIPGENITVSAVAYSNKELSNIAYSSEWTTNSLFEDVVEEPAEDEDSTATRNAKISNIRHLENLDKDISNLGVVITNANQTVDLSWAEFRTNIVTNTNYDKAEDVIVYKCAKDSSKTVVGTAPGTYYPISPDYALTYDGGIQEAVEASESQEAVPARYHSITGIVVNADDAGLFGAPEKPLAVSNLELIDFDITGSGDAGALAGKLGKGSSVTNVLAHNSSAFEAEKNKAATIISTDADGSAGGLIGSMDGTTVSKCAAALVVSGKANAGGLVGVVGDTNKSTVQACYAAGHTVDKKNGTNVIGVWYGDVSDDDNTYNITAIGSAGGLIGSLAAGSEVKNCYSTCSVSSTGSGENALAGGFVGNGSSGTSGTIENCYATGLVHGATAGAFAGKLTANPKDCKYFEIVNEIVDETTGMISYLPPVPGSDTREGIAALDESAETYNAFVGESSDWTDAEAYDATLAQYYTVGDGLKYNLKSIPRLAGDAYTASGEGMPADFVATHYGDWPAPEIFVINEKSGS